MDSIQGSATPAEGSVGSITERRRADLKDLRLCQAGIDDRPLPDDRRKHLAILRPLRTRRSIGDVAAGLSDVGQIGLWELFVSGTLFHVVCTPQEDCDHEASTRNV